MPRKRFDPAAALALGAALACLYWRLRSPSYGSGDSPQHWLSALTLSVSRPPGYPLQNFAAYLFARLAPGPTEAAVSGFSGVCAAAACALLYLCLRRQGCRPSAALTAALFMALAPLLWYYAEVPEARALNDALALLLLWSALESRWLLAGAALGLGLGHHPTFLFIVPAVFAAVKSRPPARALARATAVAAACLLLPYLALAARLRWGPTPPFNPDGVATLKDVALLFLRARTGGFAAVAPFKSLSFSASAFARQWGWFAEALATQATPVGLTLAVAGIWALARSRRRELAVWGVWLRLPAAAYICLSSLQLRGLDTDYMRAVVSRFFLLPLLGLFALAGFGAEALARRCRPALSWSLALAAALLGFSRPIDLRDHEPLRRYLDDIVAATRDGDMIIPYSDDMAFAAAASDAVDRRVQDRVWLLPWLFTDAVYVRRLERRHPSLGLPRSEAGLSRDWRLWMRMNPGRALYVEAVYPRRPGGAPLSPEGPLLRASAPGEDRAQAARLFLNSSLARLDGGAVYELTQECLLPFLAVRMAGEHLRALKNRHPEIDEQLYRTAAKAPVQRPRGWRRFFGR